MFKLPVSIGEAIDKLTILDIKIEKIKDPERNHNCKVEYDILYDELEDCVNDNRFYYDQLKDINTRIWDMQDDIRSSDSPSSKTCLDILNMNDSRFRIKDIINRKAKSILREQKGYPVKKALFLGHQGLGDNIVYVGAVRYLSLMYDEFHVISMHSHNVDNIKSFYADNPAIKVVHNQLLKLDEYSMIYRLGVHNSNTCLECDNIPDAWYTHLGLSPSIRLSHFFVHETLESKELYKNIKVPYIFVQQQSSTNLTNLVKWDINEILTLDPNVNLYQPDHTWYELAQTFINKPFNHYYETIRHAKQIHMIESSFYCMAIHLKLDADVKYCYNRADGSVNEKYTSLFISN